MNKLNFLQQAYTNQCFFFHQVEHAKTISHNKYVKKFAVIIILPFRVGPLGGKYKTFVVSDSVFSLLMDALDRNSNSLL